METEFNEQEWVKWQSEKEKRVSKWFIEQRRETTKRQIRDSFGTDYTEATLARINFPSEVQQKIFHWIKANKNFLVMISNPGVGKTYLEAAIVNDCFDRYNSIFITNENKFLDHLYKIIKNDGSYKEEISYICKEYELLCYDDIGSAGISDKNRAWREEVLMQIVSEREGSGLPTIFSTNFTLQDFETNYHERLLSRLFAEKNTVLKLYGEDKRGSTINSNGPKIDQTNITCGYVSK